MAILQYVNEVGQEDLIHVGPDRPRVLIGRTKECDLKTKNNTVSRNHAEVTWQGGRYVLKDLGSANGTFYRRQRVTEVTLEEGESFYCGTFEIVFRLDERDRVPAAPSSQAAERVSPRGGQAAEETGPPPLPFERMASSQGVSALQAALAQRPTMIPDSRSGAPPPQATPRPATPRPSEMMGRTLGYDTSAQPRGAPPSPPEEVEEVTFAVEEEAAAPPSAEGMFRRGTAAFEGEAESTEAVKFRDEVPRADLDRILKADREREAREATLQAENEQLRREIRDRDDAIRLLQVQVEELGKVVARYEATSGERDAELRIADLERVLQESEAEKVALEEALESQRALVEEVRAQAQAESERAMALSSEVQALRAERDTLAATVEGLEAQHAELSLKLEDTLRELEEVRAAASRNDVLSERATEAANQIAKLEQEVETARAQASAATETLRRIETEKAALEEEMMRWEALKRQFEEERTEVRLESEGLRKQVADLTARLAEATGAAQRVASLEEQLKAVTQELSEVKLANRSYLKKISRLLEEAEQAKAGRGGVSPEVEALQAENRRLGDEVTRLEAELAAAHNEVQRLMARLASLEAAPTTASPGSDIQSVRALIERVNDLVSEGRTSLDVIVGLVPELADRVAGTPGVGEIVEQIKTSADDLSTAIQAMKKEAVQARTLLKGLGS